MINFILRMAAIFDGRKDQLVFLINNYDLVLSVYNERSAASETEKADFEKQVQVCYGMVWYGSRSITVYNIRYGYF